MRLAPALTLARSLSPFSRGATSALLVAAASALASMLPGSSTFEAEALMSSCS